MSASDRVASLVTGHSKLIIVAVLVLTAAVGAGASQVSQESSFSQFESDSEAARATDYVETNFTSGRENVTTVQVIVRNRDGNVLSKESLVNSLAFQQSLMRNETVRSTLTENRSISGVSNVVAASAMLQEEGATLQRDERELNRTREALRSALTDLRQNPDTSPAAAFEQVSSEAPVEFTREDKRLFQRAAENLRNASTQEERRAAYALGSYAGRENPSVLADQYAALRERAAAFQERQRAIQAGQLPPLSEQRAQLESMSDRNVSRVVTTVLSGDGGGGQAIRLMSSSYEPGSPTADARTMIVFQTTDPGTNAQTGSVSDRLVDAQLVIQTLGQDASDGDEYITFGFGVISQEIDQSLSDSLAIIGPLAMLFVLITLLVAYRDLLDIVLGFVGIVSVLVWTFGFMGWTGISFNQIMIAVPVLLIGLSIDYAIHIFMRHREQRNDPETPHEDPRGSMTVALAGVGVALVWVTATTVIGFMSNLISPLGPIQDFGIASSFGILAALLVFGAFIPALKVEIDGFLESRVGLDRTKKAFGTGGGRFSDALALGEVAARKAPYVVIVFVLLLSVGGAYGATQVDTSFQQEDFIADDPPSWMYDLPEPFKPGEYNAKQNLDYVNDNFVRQDQSAQLLVRDGVTEPGTLDRVQAATDDINESGIAYVAASGDPEIRSPVSVIRRTAATNETFRAVVAANDDDGDGIPDRNLTAVYDALYRVNEQGAESVVHREGGEYRAVLIDVSVRGDATTGEVSAELRTVADTFDGDTYVATAAGQPVVNEVVQTQLLDTVIESLVVTLVAVFLFLMIAYRITEGSATLGVVTLLPVALSVSWILGTMFLLSIPFNVITGTITSLTVGLGVAYSIHLSERYGLELERRETAWDAMYVAVTGTGGALLGSAATTIGGFGVLSLAIFPALQQFGIITALTIVYAFLASVLVLPSLLVVWTRYLGPSVDWEATESGTTATAETQD